MQYKASARFQRIAPRKARLVIDLIRGKSLADAKAILAFSPRAASATVEKLLNSALANANQHNEKLNADKLYVSACSVDEGPTMKRFRAGSKGMADPILKRSCHITLVLDDGKEA
ncbi:MAG: 50S ribosomal protein L22 [Actinomycetia bacterium]|nr:50S ribosomal protein L22 [Actinomycetes bacterium]